MYFQGTIIYGIPGNWIKDDIASLEPDCYEEDEDFNLSYKKGSLMEQYHELFSDESISGFCNYTMSYCDESFIFGISVGSFDSFSLNSVEGLQKRVTEDDKKRFNELLSAIPHEKIKELLSQYEPQSYIISYGC